MYYILKATKDSCTIQQRFKNIENKIVQLVKQGKPQETQLACVLAKHTDILVNRSEWLLDDLYLLRSEED